MVSDQTQSKPRKLSRKALIFNQKLDQIFEEEKDPSVNMSLCMKMSESELPSSIGYSNTL